MGFNGYACEIWRVCHGPQLASLSQGLFAVEGKIRHQAFQTCLLALRLVWGSISAPPARMHGQLSMESARKHAMPRLSESGNAFAAVADELTLETGERNEDAWGFYNLQPNLHRSRSPSLSVPRKRSFQACIQ